MQKTLKSKSYLFILFSALSLTIVSCSQSKKVAYFQDISDSTNAVLTTAKYTDPAIQPDDILSVTVSTVDPDATKVINSGNSTTAATGMSATNTATQQLVTGYIVNKDGDINLPVMGRIHVAGLTTSQATDLITKDAKGFFQDPVVNIRFSNFRVTVIGEVNRPATYVIPNQNVTILDAIGYAGDLTIYGRRRNILLLRKEGTEGKVRAVRLDLTSTQTITSPYYYLRQNDVIYVEPTNGRVSDSNAGLFRYISIASTIITVLVLVLR